MKFKSLRLGNWKQYKHLELDFHPKVTVLTGANGSGKTTILNILSRHFGWAIQELTTPVKDEKTGKLSFILKFLGLSGEGFSSNQQLLIGEIIYDNDSSCTLTVPKNDAAAYQINYNRQGPVEGLMIPSHRPPYRYAPISQISTQKRRKQDIANQTLNNYRDRYLGAGNHGQPSNYFLKETLLAWAVNGFGNQVVEPDPEQMQFYNGFEQVLRTVLPEHIGFEKISIRNWEIVLVTKTGEFMIDAASGGLSALIDIAWQMYVYVTEQKRDMVILVDEIENHLHATMQRQLLSTLSAAFPSVQFIVTTHSPLIVGSVRDSSVYALRYDKDNRVYSTKLDLSQKAAAANDILREVLGVPFTMPIWVESELDGIVRDFRASDYSEASFVAMKQRLSAIGLSHYLPETLAAIGTGKGKS